MYYPSAPGLWWLYAVLFGTKSTSQQLKGFVYGSNVAFVELSMGLIERDMYPVWQSDVSQQLRLM